MRIYPFAKINLCLSVPARRPDGYHEIDTVYQPVSLTDILDLDKTEAPGLEFSCSDPELEGEDNLVCRAYKLLEAQLPQDCGVRARLTKRIPRQAGLGGGSSDGAAMLRGLNRLFELGLSGKELRSLAAQLGADVPALMTPRTTRGRGIGTELTPIAHTIDLPVLLIRPETGLSTADMYAALDRSGLHGNYGRVDYCEKSLRNGDIDGVFASVFNDFEWVAAIPGIGEARQSLREAGAGAACLTGSGSAVFGLFRHTAERGAAAVRLRRQGFKPIRCHFLNHMPVR